MKGRVELGAKQKSTVTEGCDGLAGSSEKRGSCKALHVLDATVTI